MPAISVMSTAGPSSRRGHGTAGSNVQRDTWASVESRAAPGDPDKQTRPATILSVSGKAAGQPAEQTSRMEAQTEERRDRSAYADLGKIWERWGI